MKRLFGVIAGMMIAFALVAGFDFLGSLLIPSGTIDFADPDTLAGYIADMPLAAKLVIVVGWLIAPLAGAWLCLRIADWVPGGWIVTAAFLVAGLLNQFALPHPLWMQMCAVVLPLFGGWLAQRLHSKPYPGEPLLG